MARPVGAMHSAYIGWARRHMLGGTILDILRADEAMSSWFALKFLLLGLGALTLHRYDVQRDLIWIWFVLGVLLRGYRGEHL
jgi:hypothetical protein